MISSLPRLVRLHTNAADDDVPVARIVEALKENSVRFDHVPVVWSDNPATPLNGYIPIGRYRVEDSMNSDDGYVENVALYDAVGDAVTDFTVTQDGRVTLTDEALQGTTMYATGTAYDVYGAAADIVTHIISLNQGVYDFKRGDQTFNRSQMLDTLRDLRKSLRARSIKKRRGTLTMRDQ